MDRVRSFTRRASIGVFVALAFVLSGAAASGEEATVLISVKGKRFQPSEIRGPANRPIVLRVKNQDGAAMEFESVSLRVEKVVAANSEGIIRLRPLAAGRYEFFDDFNQANRGTLVVE